MNHQDLFNYLYWDYLIIDCRPASQYQQSHIGVSVNIPLDSPDNVIFEIIQDSFPENKEKVLLYAGNDNGSKGYMEYLRNYLLNNIEKLKKKFCTKNEIEILLLAGSFEEFQSKYSFMCSPLYTIKDCYPSQVTENLFLGSEFSATQKKVLKNLKISAIVNCTREKNKFEGIFKYHQVPIEDSLTQDLSPYLEGAIQFIDANKAGNILIHCHQGKSRSAAVLIAYLMKVLAYEDAVALLRKARPFVQPNESFVEQLKGLRD